MFVATRRLEDLLIAATVATTRLGVTSIAEWWGVQVGFFEVSDQGTLAVNDSVKASRKVRGQFHHLVGQPFVARKNWVVANRLDQGLPVHWCGGK